MHDPSEFNFACIYVQTFLHLFCHTCKSDKTDEASSSKSELPVTCNSMFGLGPREGNLEQEQDDYLLVAVLLPNG